MSTAGKELLSKMAASYDQDHKNAFNVMFYLGTPEYVLDELENDGYISKVEDIIGTIMLTESGYKEAKR